MSREEHETAWRKLHWPVDEIFMAWHYAKFVNKVMEEGKAEYCIPMFVNAWLQQPNMAWPGTYPSGGPLPQVHDVWRAGAPGRLAGAGIYTAVRRSLPALHAQRNPLFIPETSANAANVLAFVSTVPSASRPSHRAGVGPETDLAAAYRLVAQMAPAIVAHQGKNTMTLVRMNEGYSPHKVSLGN